MARFVEGDTHDAALQRRDPTEVPSMSVLGDARVKLVAAALDPFRKGSGKRPRAVKKLGQRPAGHLVLVQREDRGATLVGAAHGNA